MYLITTAITTNKIIALIVVVVVVAAGAFFWMRSRRSAVWSLSSATPLARALSGARVTLLQNPPALFVQRTQRVGKPLPVGSVVQPAALARRVRQRHHHRVRAECSPHPLFQAPRSQEPRDGHLPHQNQHLRPPH